MSAKEPFYVTTPIYYVNDEPHIGHMYTTIVADTVARYRRATGHDVRFLTGTDEHGQKIERAAGKLGIPPAALADRVVSRYHALWKTLRITHDDFIRTTEPRHAQGVARLLAGMTAAGDIYRGSYEGLYCAGCEAFYPEGQIKDGRCEQGHPVEAVSEASYFFRLASYQRRLLEHYEAHPDFVRPASRFNEVKAFVASGLKDLSISRTTIRWGIPWPGDPAHTVYVWVDALTNYISALGYGSDDEGLYRRYWPARVHLVGKDIIRFHAVYWPAFLMSAGLPLPECIFAHGWWLKDDAKMSKSLGNVVRPQPLLDAVGPDALRYFLLREMTFGLDGAFSDEQLIDRYNGDLANELGNLTSRVIALCETGFAGGLPPPSDRPEARELSGPAAEAHAAWRRAFDAYEFSTGIAAAFKLAAEANRFLQTHAPWALAKNPAETGRHAAVLRGAAEAILQIAAMISPVMPGASAEIADRLGTAIPGDLSEFRWGLLPASGRVAKRAPLFARVDKSAYFEEKTPVSEQKPDLPAPPAAQAPAPSGSEEITIDDFLRVNLRVARVVSAERIEGADKLLKLQLDLGTERRQIVAGIAKAYAPEALVGKSIVVVANLKPAKLRGVESQGMLLAADLDGRPIVATFEDDVRPGTRVR
ncbi:MAG TPA: methionine--tRNA ligase [Candidatus Sulfotelmatobacter sp.]|jgi:methionyl-tRNA synthetase|nr:methionine--tRNA ligase [Candidatus Sulfotelmatobacter sp.]